MPKTGEKPGKGDYKCVTCGHRVVLNESADTLPCCPKCADTNFIKI